MDSDINMFWKKTYSVYVKLPKETTEHGLRDWNLIINKYLEKRGKTKRTWFEILNNKNYEFY